MMAAVLGHIGDLKSWALLYATAGLEIFPLHPDKTPRTANGMKDATTDPATIDTWWTTWPNALIGCRIPPDVVVLDVDPKHNGMATWAALKTSHGPTPKTRGHRSGRNDGGGHRWFQRPPGRLSIAPLNRWAKEHGTGHAVGKHSWVSGIDILHHGHRYTILPPSPHPNTGQPYQWLAGQGPELAPAELPAWLAALITEQSLPQPIPAPRVTQDELDSIADWFSVNNSWHDLLRPEGWTCVHGDGDQDGSQWRHPNATSKFSATVKHGCLFVYSTSTDFVPTEDGQPHGYTPFKAWAVLAHGGENHQHLSAAARAARYLKDGTPTGNGRDDWSWVCLTKGTGTTVTITIQPANEPPTIQPIDWETFWAREHPGEDWLVEPLIPRNRQVALWAVHKTGKSLLTLEVAAAIATGQATLNQPAAPPADVIYLDFEMTEDDLHDRLSDLGYGPDTNLDHLHYYLLPALPALDTPAGSTALLELVDLHHATLVVIDTMARVVAGQENDADTYRAFYRHTGLHLKARGVSVLRLDHGGKNAELGQRGSSAKGDDVDLVWELRDLGTALQLRRDASRISWAPEQLTLTREDDPVLRHIPSTETAWPAGTKEIAEWFDTISAPIGISTRAAIKAYRDAALKATNDVIRAAVKYRRMQRPDPSELI